LLDIVKMMSYNIWTLYCWKYW